MMKQAAIFLSICLLAVTLIGCFGSGDQYKTPSNPSGKESTQQTKPETSTPQVQTQSEEEMFKTNISKDMTELTNYLARELKAAQDGDIFSAADVYEDSFYPYSRIMNIVAPAGYEDIKHEYVLAAINAYNAIDHLQQAATAKYKGDATAYGRFTDLANGEMESATEAMNRAKELVSAKQQ